MLTINQIIRKIFEVVKGKHYTKKQANKRYASSISVSQDIQTGVVTISLYANDGTFLDSKELDLDTEHIIQSINLDYANKVLIFTLTDGSAINCDISDLIDSLSNDINTVAQSITSEANRATLAEGALDNRITTIENDYLKTSDKNELAGNITAEENRAKGVENTKADKVVSGTENNIVILDANGNIKDSGKSFDDTGKVDSISVEGVDVPVDANKNINLTKTQFNLNNVDNTHDLDKPISTAARTELNKKINFIEVIDIRSLTSAQIEELKAGDIVIKISDGEKHAYMVAYKKSNEMSLVYCDYWTIEEVYYEKESDVWSHVVTDILSLSNKEDKSNKVKSTDGWGVDPSDDKYPSEKLVKAALDLINAIIPNQAYDAGNELADKDFVNSSIATATADFKGTYTSVGELPLIGVDNNDYAFVMSVDVLGNTSYARYKYDGAQWLYEYTLNNSSFTSAQWSAINSGITASLVSDINANTAARHTHANKALLDDLDASDILKWDSKLDLDDIRDYTSYDMTSQKVADIFINAERNLYPIVTINPVNGDPVVQIEVERGQTVSRPSDPTQSGYVFLNWYDNNGIHDFTSPVMKSELVFARWDHQYTDTSEFTFSYKSRATLGEYYQINSYSGSGATVCIPPTYNDGTNGEHPVSTMFYSTTFSGSTITEIDFPDNFSPAYLKNMTGLVDLVIGPNSSLSDTASASALTNIYFNGSKDQWFTLKNSPSNGKKVYVLDPEGSVSHNGNKYSLLTELTVPSTYTDLSTQTSGALSGLNDLTKLTVPNTVTKMTDISNLVSLEELIVPFIGYLPKTPTDSSITSMAYMMDVNTNIHGNKQIQITAYQAYYNENNPSSDYYGWYSSDGYVPVSLKKITVTDAQYITAFAFCNLSMIEEVDIKSNVLSIEYKAFEGCSSLKKITIPNTFTSIGSYAFKNCLALEEITIPEGVTEIRQSTFLNCYALEEIVLPSTITSIGEAAFGGCSGLTSITIREGLLTIGARAFTGCTSLATLDLPSTVTSIASGVIGNSNVVNLIVRATTPPTLTSLEDYLNLPTNLKIYVPAESLDTYKTTSGWSQYAARIYAIEEE